MKSYRNEKALIRHYYKCLDQAVELREINDVITQFVSEEAVWRGFHPFGEMKDPHAVAERFWYPLKKSIRSLQRRMDIFIAGQNRLKERDEVWVVSMGHLMGLFDHPWLGIRSNSKLVMFRYCEFNRVENDKITETAFYFDIPHLMMQAGLNPFPPQTAAQLVQPGPMTHNGILFEDAPEGEGVKTLAAINAMLDSMQQWHSGLPLEQELSIAWNKDMLWWGPAGIGSTYTIERYAKQHAGPFRAAFSDRSRTTHLCKLAEGHFGGFFGWPNFTAVHIGGFMGLPASAKPLEFRVIDMYRREGDKLAENWIFIDLLHFFAQQGVDLLKRMETIHG